MKTLALKLAKKHPALMMRHGNHVIENVPYLFDLDESEVKLLETAGPKHWIKEVNKEGVDYKVKKVKLTEKEKLFADLKEMGVKVNKKMNMEKLENLMVEALAK